MRISSILYWMGCVTAVVLLVMGYEKYMKGGRGPVLHKATNAMGSLKQDMNRMRSKYDSVLGVNGGGAKMNAEDQRRQKMREANRRLLNSNR